jgi:hypothetical protein
MLLSSNYAFLTPKPLLHFCVFVSFLLFICCLTVPILVTKLLNLCCKVKQNIFFYFNTCTVYPFFIILCNEPTNAQLIDKLLYC